MWQFPLVDKPHGRERDILNMEQDSAPVIENIATIPSKEPLVLPISSDRVVNDHPPPLRTIFPPLVLEEHPVDQPRALRAIIVGAGISGITSGILLPAKVPRLDLVIYERESDIVGRDEEKLQGRGLKTQSERCMAFQHLPGCSM